MSRDDKQNLNLLGAATSRTTRVAQIRMSGGIKPISSEEVWCQKPDHDAGFMLKNQKVKPLVMVSLAVREDGSFQRKKRSVFLHSVMESNGVDTVVSDTIDFINEHDLSEKKVL